jgi:hypothetical protein
MEITIENVESQVLFTHALEQAVYWAYQSACVKHYPALRTQHQLDNPEWYHDQAEKHLDIALWINEACRPLERGVDEHIAQRNRIVNRVIDRAHERAREELLIKEELNEGAREHIA